LETTQRLALALQQLDRMLAFFPRVEGKASFLFALDLSLVGTAFAVVSWKATQENLLFAILLGLVALLCAGSLVFLYFAYAPHLAPAKSPSMLYFRDVESLGVGALSDKWRSITEDEMLDDVLHQIQRNAEILTKKFNATEGAFTLTAFSIVPWFVLLVLSIVERQSFVIGG
jgi:hypothetical protein